MEVLQTEVRYFLMAPLIAIFLYSSVANSMKELFAFQYATIYRLALAWLQI